MDKNPSVRKGLAVGIILLFITISIIPSTAQNSKKNQFFDTTQVPLPSPKGWAKTFGGTENDGGWSVQQTTDGGYIIIGVTYSFGAGNADVWLIKTDEYGDKVWDKTFGGTSYDWGFSVQQTTDNGYIISGETASFSAGKTDVWLIKTDNDGNMLWNKTFGGTENDGGWSVQQTTDGGYIIAGYTTVSGTDDWDVWLIKTDEYGDEIWDKTFGGTNDDHGYSVIQTTDGGYIITGYTSSYVVGPTDVLLIKTDEYGNEIWNRTFGGMSYDCGYSVQQTRDNGYVVIGVSYSDNDSDINAWLIKIDNNGDEVWNRFIGGSGYDIGRSLRQTVDGGYIIIGYTSSYGVGKEDVWLIKTDEYGKLVWDKTFGGTETDEGLSICQTTDGGYIITGYTTSSGVGLADVWLIKTDEYGCISNPPNTPTITGETNGAIQTSYNYTIFTTDPDQDDVQYYINWGDNTTTITGLLESGEEIVVSHIWNNKGTFSVKIKAIDEYYAESDWASLTVTMPCSYNKLIPQFLELLFQRFPNAFPILRHFIE
jgi:hypothetical protein